MGLVDSLRSKYELYRLEQRYTRRDKRTTFASNAQYVDGEYVYGDAVSSPTSPKSSKSSSSSSNSGGGSLGGSWSAAKGRVQSVKVTEVFAREGKRLSRVW